MKMLILSSLFVLSQVALAGEAEHSMPNPTVAKEFAVMKQLLGTWVGTTQMQGQEAPMKVTYRLSSAGTAVTERMMEGTDHEMVSVYHKDGDSLAMTHYCALGNQPHMKLKAADAKSISFEMDEPRGIQSTEEPHMHAVTLTLKSDNELQQQWTHYVNGKQADIVTFNLTRQN